MLTKTKLYIDKKRKKRYALNTVLPPTAPQKPQHKRPTGGQYAAAQTFGATKKRHPFFD
jgi:hypothetical protein